MLPQTLSEKAQLKNNAKNRKLQFGQTQNLRDIIMKIKSGCFKEMEKKLKLLIFHKSEHPTRLLELVDTINWIFKKLLQIAYQVQHKTRTTRGPSQ